MRLVSLTPGTGNFFCGACLRDQTLATALRRRGHNLTLLPLYLPLVLETDAEPTAAPLFFGGVTCFLEQHSAYFTRLPRWLDRTLNAPALLRQLARFSHLTTARNLGAMTLSMLRGEEGRQAVELAKLITWLKTQPPPDAIFLPNLLLVGLARRLKEAFRVPVLCTLHGEDTFLDDLPEPYRQRCWQLAATRAADVDRFVTGSRYYRDVIQKRIHLTGDRIAVVPNGIDLAGYNPAPAPVVPTIGYLARLIAGKGLGTLVDAFIELRQRMPTARLILAGAKTPADNAYVRRQQKKLAAAGLSGAVEWRPNLSRAGKLAFFRELSVFSVPATYGEAFGLYLLEAWAAGVPVVQPRHGAFPELIAATGGGVLCEPDDPSALAAALENLLQNPERARQLGAAGRAAVERDFTTERMAAGVEGLVHELRR